MTTSPVSPWVIAPLVAMAAFMEILDISIANVALQHVAGDMSASQEQSTWILTSYLVTNAVILPLSGWFSSVIGRRKFFIGCVIGFSISSLCCGLATSLPMLIAFRAIQGLTGGGLQPSSQAILTDAFPPSKRGMAFALYGMAVVFAPAIGPTLGGWITDNLSWRWIFLINVPVGMILVPLLAWAIRDTAHATERRKALTENGFSIDYLGFALLALGLGTLQVMLDKGQQEDWFGSNMIIILAVLSVIGLVGFVLWELGQDHPIVDLHLLRDPNFAGTTVLSFLLGFMVFGTTALLPLMVQSLYGYTATLAGEVLSPGGFALILLMPMIGKLVDRFDPRYMIAVGVVVDCMALVMMTWFSPEADYATFTIARIVQTMGMGFMFIPISTVQFGGLGPDKIDQASSISALARNLGGSVGISVIIAYLIRDTQARRVDLAAHVTGASPFYRQMSDTLSGAFTAHGATAAEALTRAQTMINNTIEQQANFLAYTDTYRAFAIAILIMLPMVMLTRRPPHHHGDAPMGH